MIFYMIKNNLKLMLRNKWIVYLMILGPICVIATLSSAFNELMKSYEKTDSFQVGYTVEEDGAYAARLKQIKETGEEAGISFIEYSVGDPKDLIQQNDLAAFVEFKQNEYKLYRIEDYKEEGMTLEYFLSQISNPASYSEGGNINLQVTELDFMQAISAKDYYGIVFVVYFIWCGLVCLTGVLSSERKNSLERKYQVSPLSGTGLFFARFLPCTILVSIEMLLVSVISSILFGITWGNILWSILIVFLSIMTASAVGLMIYYIFNHLAVTIVVLFIVVWINGFIGGSFETYMFSSCPEKIQRLSPIYYIDRTLVEYSCMGKSSFTNDCILYLVILLVGSIAISLFAEKIRRKVKA